MLSRNLTRRILHPIATVILGAGFGGAFASSLFAQEPGVVNVSAAAAAQRAAEVQAYWSPERMKTATTLPPRGPDAVQGRTVTNRAALTSADAYPMLIPGWNPKSGKPQPTKDNWLVFGPGDPQYAAATAIAPRSFGSPPANPTDYANYGKFQRWSWWARYQSWPTSVIGKMFFSQGGLNYVCSGTIVNRNMFITAGHCVSDGAGDFSTNMLICPSYNANGINPNVGCWPWASATTSESWHTASDFDRDYACVVTQPTGTVLADSVGNVTGWAGVAVNWGNDQMIFSTGYPAGAPFPGFNIIFTAAVEWYAVNTGGDGNVSKYIGNDMTGGSSGGGWLMSISHPTREYAVVDDSALTDPLATSGPAAGPYVNGVNSHSRCMTACTTPPTSSQGVFWDEMGSPSFTSSGSDGEDVVDVYNDCLANGGG
jgi:Trypsin